MGHPHDAVNFPTEELGWMTLKSTKSLSVYRGSLSSGECHGLSALLGCSVAFVDSSGFSPIKSRGRVLPPEDEEALVRLIGDVSEESDDEGGFMEAYQENFCLTGFRFFNNSVDWEGAIGLGGARVHEPDAWWYSLQPSNLLYGLLDSALDTVRSAPKRR